MKKFLIVLIILFICGVLSADVCLKQMEETTLIGREVYEQYANTKQGFQQVFWNVFYERIKLLGVVLLLFLTPIKERVGMILGPIFCFVWGFFLMSCIIELGFVGVIVGLASVLPHGYLYGQGLWFLLRKSRAKTYLARERLMLHILSYLGLVLLFLSGCILETLMGSSFIPWVIRLSMI